MKDPVGALCKKDLQVFYREKPFKMSSMERRPLLCGKVLWKFFSIKNTPKKSPVQRKPQESLPYSETPQKNIWMIFYVEKS